MKLTFVRSSTVIVESEGVRILMDPWLVEGAFFGSWYHYPPLDFEPSRVADVDFIYISHVHPDHCSTETLRALPRNIPVLIHSYAEKFLKANIESLGFAVTELPHGVRTHLKGDVHITVLAADNCDPELCGRWLGCVYTTQPAGSMQVDSLCIVDDGRHSIINVNDCPFELAKTACREVLRHHPRPDLLLVGYSGAGAYPQCFSGLTDTERRQKADAKERSFLRQAEQFIELLRPKYYLPFAGTYLLSGRLARLNAVRGVPTIDAAYAFLEQSEVVRMAQSTSVRLNPFALFDLDSGTASEPYQALDISEYQRYISAVLPAKTFEYDSDPLPTLQELMPVLVPAHKRMVAKARTLNFVSNTKVFIPLVEGLAARLSVMTEDVVLVPAESLDTENNFVSLKVDPRLLLRLLRGPRFAHWNNAEAGSHIEYTRRPDVFERGLHHLINYLHA